MFRKCRPESKINEKMRLPVSEHGTATVWACVQKAAAILNAESGGGEAVRVLIGASWPNDNRPPPRWLCASCWQDTTAKRRRRRCEPTPLARPAVLTLFKKAFWDQRRDM